MWCSLTWHRSRMRWPIWKGMKTFLRSSLETHRVLLHSPPSSHMLQLVSHVQSLLRINSTYPLVTHIIRQGRCTLVATIQMYKILALNCLITAYSLSVQYLDGIKFGDYQVTVSGMLMSVCFLCISRAQVRYMRLLFEVLLTYVVFYSLLRSFRANDHWAIFSTSTCCCLS